MAAIISVFNIKGGVGKTTTVSAISSYYSSKGARVLMMDMSFNRSLTDSFIDKSVTSYEDTLVNAVILGSPLSIFSLRDNLSLAPCWSLYDIENAENSKVLKGIKTLLDGLSGSYDLIIIDLPSVIGPLVHYLLLLSDRVIVPAKADKVNFHSLRTVMSYLEDYDRESCVDILISMHDAREKNSAIFEQRIREGWPSNVLRTVIRKNISLSESATYYQSIFEYRPRSSGAVDFSEFSDEFYDRLNNTFTNI